MTSRQQSFRAIAARMHSSYAWIFFGTLLGLLGYFGNICKIELFYGVDFLFGSIFSIYALLRFGFPTAVFAASIASVATYVLWGHPWAVIVFVSEVIFIAFLNTRKGISPLNACLLFWFILGAPLLWIFYHNVMGIQKDSTMLIILKQSVNGFINTLIASLLHIVATRKRNLIASITLQSVLLYLIVSLVVLPSPAVLFLNAQNFTKREETRLALKATHFSEETSRLLELKVSEHWRLINAATRELEKPANLNPSAQRNAMRSLMAAADSAEQLAFVDASGIIRTAVSSNPQQDSVVEGLSIADTSHFRNATLMRKAVVSDVFKDRFNHHGAMLVLLEPVQTRQTLRGFSLGVLNVGKIEKMVREFLSREQINQTILDAQGRVIFSTYSNLAAMQDFSRPKGEFRNISAECNLWIPDATPGVSVMQRWRNSVFVVEKKGIAGTNWTLLTEASMLPVLGETTNLGTSFLAYTAILIIIALVSSKFLSQTIIRSLVNINETNKTLPAIINTDTPFILPRSMFVEVNSLVETLENIVQALRNSLKNEIAVAEKEKRLVCEKELLMKDLHDGIGGSFFNIGMLSNVAIKMNNLDDVRESLGKISTLARDGVIEVRSYMNSADESDVTWMALYSELCEYATTMLSPHGFNFHPHSTISSESQPSLGVFKYGTIVKIFRETITNIVKHSNSRNVHFSFDLQNEQFNLIVRDDGIGMNTALPKKRGLANITSRALAIGGKLDISADGGTIVSLSVKL